MRRGIVPIEDAARHLGRKLVGRVPHVVGVCLRRGNKRSRELQLFVEVDIKATKIPEVIPNEFEGHVVHIRRIPFPRMSVPQVRVG